MPTEKEMVDALRKDKVKLPPLSIYFLEEKLRIDKSSSFNALLKISWQKSSAIYAVECRTINTPKMFFDGLNRLKAARLPQNYQPLLFLPFLSEQQLLTLEQEHLSGLDLCGNGIIFMPGKFTVFRSGKANCFTSSAPIKNIYRKNSSMAGRIFLCRSNYDSVQAVRAEINERNVLVRHWGKKPISLATVSKALKALEEELIVGRKKTITLLQPDKLLEKLRDNYIQPKIKDRVRLKLTENEALYKVLLKHSRELGLPLVATGLSSVNKYANMQRGGMFSVYCPQISTLLDRLNVNHSSRFPDLELIETEDETVYFDARQDEKFCWSSPIQVFLELMTGDKRDREVAEHVQAFILANLKRE